MATDDQAHDYHFFVSKIAFFALLKLTYIFIKYNLVSKYVLHIHTSKINATLQWPA